MNLKKLIASALTLLMILSALPLTALATSTPVEALQDELSKAGAGSITQKEDPVSEEEEDLGDEEVYEEEIITDDFVECALEEHIHSEDCYVRELVCEHVSEEEHTDECFVNSLVCGLEEHTHDALACYGVDMSGVGMFSLARSSSTGVNDYTINSTTSTDNYYNLISKKDWAIAPGITESEIVLNNDAGSRRQVLFVMEADLNNEYVEVTHSYTGMKPQYGSYTTGVMSEQAAWAENNGYGNVVGAMNTCLSWYTGYSSDRVGEPLGFIMYDAEIYFDPANCGYEYGNVGFPSVLVINKDFDEEGNPRPADIPKVEMPQIRSSADLDGWEQYVIPCSSGYIVKDGKNAQTTANHSDAAPRSVVGIKPDGTAVIMLNDGRQDPYSAGMSMYELAEVMLDLGCSYAVNCDGGGSSTYLSQRPGEDLKVNNSPSDGGERPTTSGILFISTAPATDEFVNAVITTDYEYYTPNSSVQFNAIATNLVGEQVDMPENIVWQLADDSYGTISSDGLFLSNGTIGTVIAQLVYDDVVMGEKEIQVVWPTDFAFSSEVMVIPFGKTVAIEMIATYNGAESYVALKDGDVNFTLSDNSLGAVSGFEFAASNEESASVTQGTLTATINGISATTRISLGKGSQVIFDFDSPDSANDWVLKDYNVYSTNTDSIKDVVIENALEIVTHETGKVHSGDSAIAVTVDYSNGLSGGWTQFRLIYEGDYFEIKNAKRLGFWIWMPDEAYANEIDVCLAYIDANGKLAKGAPVLTDIGYCMSGQDEPGWRYFTTDISSQPIMYIGKHEDTTNFNRYFYLQFYNYTNQWQKDDSIVNTMSKFTYFIDDITIEYSDAVDDANAPVFGDVSLIDNNGVASVMNGQTISFNTIGAEVSVADYAKDNATGINAASAKAYVDGYEVDCSYAGGRISISDITVADGLHTVKFAVCDNMGNMNSIIRQIRVNADSSIPTVNLVPHDEELTNLPCGSVYYVDLVATDIEKVQKLTVDLDLVNTFDWELAYAEVAAGFELSYEVDRFTNVACITVTRTGNVALSGNHTIASIPVRVWSHTVDRGNRTGTELTEVYLTIKGQGGVLECVDGTVSTFTCDSVKVATELWMNQWNAPSGFEGIILHEHTVTALDDKTATCTEIGYTGRTYCEVCESVVDWGETEAAISHNWQFNEEGVLACANDPEHLFTGTYTDGKEYVNGVTASDGWNADHTAYYKDGKKVTGSHIIDGVMCTFDEDGVYDADYIYDGWYETNNTVMFFVSNEYLTGYQKLESKPYYFDNDGMGYDGNYVIDGKTCVFENGLFDSCEDETVIEAGWCGASWNKEGLHAVEYMVYSDATIRITGKGDMMNVAEVGVVPWSNHVKTFLKTIFIGKGITKIGNHAFRNCFAATSIVFEEGSGLTYIGSRSFHNMRALKEVKLPEAVQILGWSSFGYSYALKNIYMPSTLTSIDKEAFVKTNENLVMDVEAESLAETYAKENGIDYTVREKVLKNGVINEGGVLYYYIDGTRTNAGLVKVDGYYYYASTGGVCKTGKYWVSRTNDLLPAGYYFFDEETGKMQIKNGVYNENGGIYYYKDGALSAAGLIKIGDDYYYASTGGVCKTGKYWVSRPNGLMSAGYYFFDEETGKMIR